MSETSHKRPISDIFSDHGDGSLAVFEPNEPSLWPSSNIVINMITGEELFR